MAFAAFSASEGRYGGERGRKRRMGVDRVSYGFGPVTDWPPWRSPRFSASEGRYDGECGRSRRMGVGRGMDGFGPVCDWPPWRSPRFGASEGRHGGERGRKRRMGVDRVSYGFGPVTDWPYLPALLSPPTAVRVPCTRGRCGRGISTRRLSDGSWRHARPRTPNETTRRA